jgi:hypothetical protein
MRILSLISGLIVSLLVLGFGAGCGKEIGDACNFSTDCSPNGDRQCEATSKEGYCTVVGCDFDTCPEEAVCVRFFGGGFANKQCDHLLEDVEGAGDDRCSFDEVCSINDTCVSRSSETRFCMRKCDSDGDCRDGYECRTFGQMRDHGGEPVLRAGEKLTEQNAQKFCATAPAEP